MKKILLFLAATTILAACKNNTNQGEEKAEASTEELAMQDSESQPEMKFFGDTISEEGAISVAELKQKMQGNDSLKVKLTGNINSSCQKKGCWMKMDLGNGEEMMIRFKDYGFFVPKNLDGEMAIVDGYAYIDTMTVAQLRHYAADAGKSKEEQEKITEPEVKMTYLAKGVIIKS